MKKIGLLIEGGIDEDILRPLIDNVLADELPLFQQNADFFEVVFPPNGYGEIPKNLQILIKLYQSSEERQRIGCGLFVIVHDSRKTKEVQKQIRDILRQASCFPAVYAIAIQEIEAWVLGDIDHVNKKVFRIDPAPKLPKSPENDPDPKKTLTELFIRPSKVIEYDCWNRECARLVAAHLRYSQVAARCPRGFGKFVQDFKKQAAKIDE